MQNNQDYIDDTRLVKQARAGDLPSFSTLIKRYKDKSLSLACSIAKDQSMAEDILQDAFIRAYQGLKSFKMKSKFSTWLYRIVVNTAYNTIKKQDRTVELQSTQESYKHFEEDIALNALTLQDQQFYINLALSKMKSDEALVLRLFYLCDMSIKEITEITRYSKSKIKVDMHRGRQNMEFQLKLLLGKEYKHLL